ncbi:MAG: 30S ribosomal protein S6 [Desulfobacterales bacterium]
MRRYETIFIIDPDLSDEERNPVVERLQEIINQHGGFLVITDEWGSKKLAYEVKKKVRGYYIRIDYCGTGKLVNEIERFFRIDDRVMKYMSVLLERKVDVEKIKEEKAKSELEEDLHTENNKLETTQNLSYASEDESLGDKETHIETNEQE